MRLSENIFLRKWISVSSKRKWAESREGGGNASQSCQFCRLFPRAFTPAGGVRRERRYSVLSFTSTTSELISVAFCFSIHWRRWRTVIFLWNSSCVRQSVRTSGIIIFFYSKVNIVGWHVTASTSCVVSLSDFFGWKIVGRGCWKQQWHLATHKLVEFWICLQLHTSDSFLLLLPLATARVGL